MEQTPSIGKIAVDTALLFFFAVVLLLVGSYVPLLGTFAMFLWSLPVILAIFRDGMIPGAVLSLILAVLLFLIFGVIDSVMTVGLCCVLALFYGIRMKKKVSAENTLFMGIGIGIVLGGAYIALAVFAGGLSLENIRLSFEQEMFAVYSAYAESGILDEALLEGFSIETYISDMVGQMIEVLPAFFFMIVIIVSAMNYVVAQVILKKRSYDIQALPIFREWHLPWWVLWGVVLALTLFVCGNFFELEILRIVAKNILICYAPILLVAGISLVRWFCVSLHLNDGMQVLIWICAALFLSVSLIFLILIGAADAAMNYRAAAMKKKNNNDGGHKI